MSRTSVILVALVAFVALGASTPAVARAGGVRVGKWLTLAELVGDARVILEGQVIKTSHLYNRRRAYGRDVRYLSSYRVFLRVEAVVRGPSRLRGAKVLLIKRSPGVPGRWALVARAYRHGLPLGPLKKGQRLVALADVGIGPTTAKPSAWRLLAAERPARATEIRRLAAGKPGSATTGPAKTAR